MIKKKDKTSFSDLVIQNATDVYNSQRINNKDKCLIDKKEAKKILKYKYKINNLKIDNNLRFKLGKCNPVLLVPGLFATKLVAEFNCKGLADEEKDTTLKEIRLYCGDTICSNEENTNEEYPLLFVIDKGPFSIKVGDKVLSDEYSACLGHILNFYQNKNEC